MILNQQSKYAEFLLLPLIMPRLLHLRLIFTSLSGFPSSVWGENPIVIMSLSKLVHRLVNSIWKKPQCIVHNSSHDVYNMSCQNVSLLFLNTQNCISLPVHVHVPFYSKGAVKIYSPLWFIHPELSTLSNVPVKDAFIDKVYFPARELPFLNILITWRMVSCGRRSKCTSAVSGNPKITLAAFTYPKAWTGSLSRSESPYFLLFYQEEMFKVAKLHPFSMHVLLYTMVVRISVDFIRKKMFHRLTEAVFLLICCCALLKFISNM